MPSEHVVRKGAVGKEMFFIYRGKCTVLANDNKSPLFTLKQGSFFGEIALVLNERRTASVIAASFCDVHPTDIPHIDIHIPTSPPSGDRRRVLRHPHPPQRRPLPCDPRLPQRRDPTRRVRQAAATGTVTCAGGAKRVRVSHRLAWRARHTERRPRGRPPPLQDGRRLGVDHVTEGGRGGRAPPVDLGAVGRRSPRSNAEGKKPVYASGTRRRGSGDASATSFARERRDSDANMQCSSIIDFLKANPISTAAKLCNSSLNSSKTNSRASSAVATPVVRSRRGSHDAGRSRVGRLTGRRHSLGAEGTTRRRGSNPDVAPVPEDSATSGASFKGRNKQRRGVARAAAASAAAMGATTLAAIQSMARPAGGGGGAAAAALCRRPHGSSRPRHRASLTLRQSRGSIPAIAQRRRRGAGAPCRRRDLELQPVTRRVAAAAAAPLSILKLARLDLE